MSQLKINPCIDHCFIRHNKQYESGKCEKECVFAAVCAEKCVLEQELEACRRKLNLLQNMEDAVNA